MLRLQTGGEARRPERANYCSRTHEGGCFVDAACIATCHEEHFGYSAACAACFGIFPTCSIDSGCLAPW